MLQLGSLLQLYKYKMDIAQHSFILRSENTHAHTQSNTQQIKKRKL